jgi:hypothetical protein
MNDPIKDFVDQHRGEFDHLEAPVLQLDQLKKKIKKAPEVRKKDFSMLNFNRWLVAASVLVMLTAAWLFLNAPDNDNTKVKLVKTQTDPTHEAPTNSGSEGISADAVNNHSVAEKKQAAKPLLVARFEQVKQNAPKVIMPGPDIYAMLKDSTSASSRLLAILEIEKADQVDDLTLKMLALTLNHDKNTNVRLAALSLMEKLSHKDEVTSMLISSLDRQDDPIVQLGLVSYLGNIKNIDIDDKLESLANSPYTFAAVRDEAYSILLKQNKL